MHVTLKQFPQTSQQFEYCNKNQTLLGHRAAVDWLPVAADNSQVHAGLRLVLLVAVHTPGLLQPQQRWQAPE